MAWTYDADLSDRKDEVRFLVGDTIEADPLVQDSEIEYILTQYPPHTDRPAWLAGAHVCDAIAGQFARRMQQSVGPLSKSAQQQWEHYRQMAADLRALYLSNGLTTATTGMSGIRAAAPLLGGGGRTYLGSSAYADPEGL